MSTNLSTEPISQKRKYRKKLGSGHYVRAPYIPNQKERERLYEIKALYEKLGSLEAVATNKNITRERVRQLLEKGQKYNLFEYEITRKKRFKELIKRIPREEMVQQIMDNVNRFVVCDRLDIDMTQYLKLISHYQLDTKDLLIDARQKKYLIKYSKVVDELGHHPSTTEMASRKNWRYTWMAISRIWGSFENFRKEYRIEKPPYAFNENQVRGFKQAREKRQKNKKVKIEKVKAFLEERGTAKIITIMKELGYGRLSLTSYLNDLRKAGTVKRIGKGNKVKYKFIKRSRENETMSYL